MEMKMEITVSYCNQPSPYISKSFVRNALILVPMYHTNMMSLLLEGMADMDPGDIIKRIYDHNLVLRLYRMYHHKSVVLTMDDFVDLVLCCKNMCSALVSVKVTVTRTFNENYNIVKPLLYCSPCGTWDNPI